MTQNYDLYPKNEKKNLFKHFFNYILQTYMIPNAKDVV